MGAGLLPGVSLRHGHSLASRFALVAVGLSTAHAHSFSSVISFGDRLSDGGQYSGLVPGAAGGFTTNPDPVAIKLIAQRFGCNLLRLGLRVRY
jgi:hypothetical protein